MALKSGLDRSYVGQMDPSTGASRLRSMLLGMSGKALEVEAGELFSGG